MKAAMIEALGFDRIFEIRHDDGKGIYRHAARQSVLSSCSQGC
jgi:hypothetical protein